MAKTFCPIPWVHSAVQTNGQLQLCCQCVFPPFGAMENSDGRLLNAAVDTMSESRNHTLLKQVRSSMLNGEKPAVCQLCWNEEANGIKSKRKHQLEIYPEVEKKAKRSTERDGAIRECDFPVRYLDLRFGNHCNFKCRYCGPFSSTAWYEDWVSLQGDDTEQAPHFYFNGGKRYDLERDGAQWKSRSNDFNWFEKSPYFSQLLQSLEHVDRFYFTGGEPTLIRAHWQLIEKCIEVGVAKNIVLEYNTNMSSLSSKHLELWGQFKQVNIGCSIDGLGDVAEYLRPPVKWSVIEKNIRSLGAYGEPVLGIFATTLSVFNVLHFLDVSKWLLETKLPHILPFPEGQILSGPSYYNIQILPIKAKQRVREKYHEYYKWIKKNHTWGKYFHYKKKLEAFLSYMDAADQSNLIDEFYQQTERLDRIRGHCFKSVLPEVDELLQM